MRMKIMMIYGNVWGVFYVGAGYESKQIYTTALYMENSV